MNTGKIRLDIFLVDKNFFPSREKARDAIVRGAVIVDNRICSRPSFQVTGEEQIEILLHLLPRYVSRGGLKLEKAIREFQIELQGMTILDIGASTGGFTDCCLQHGAERVFAVDVGHDQLDPSLRNNPRVITIEDTDIRELNISQLHHNHVDMIVGDVSFISLGYIFPHCNQFLRKNGKIVFLIKPQFEAGRKWIGKNGIVRSPVAHTEVLENMIKFSEQHGFHLNKLTFAPVFSADKNIEYLGLFSSSSERDFDIRENVRMAFMAQKRRMG
ncbi:MAG: TlyA family RNA methyltransferase [Bacteroidetes bacterium]|nr:TlyA family RNA methyltransferase [Bacteroidota bacterium]